MTTLDETIAFLGSSTRPMSGPRPIPDPMDDDVRLLITALVQADDAGRALITSILGERHGWVLKAFAVRMAGYAVRTGQSRFIEESLVALAFALHLVVDWRDWIPAMSLAERSALKLGLDARKLFKAAAPWDSDFQKQVKTWFTRAAPARAIEAFSYVEVQDQDGFRYVYQSA